MIFLIIVAATNGHLHCISQTNGSAQVATVIEKMTIYLLRKLLILKRYTLFFGSAK